MVSEQRSRSPLDLQVILAFFAIYCLWGTTFLAIRIAVAEVPPLLAAGLRFFTAGVFLYGLMRLRGEARPTLIQWRNLAFIGLVMFVADYGPLFWAEKYLSSGVASVLAATVPLITILMEILIFRQQPFRWSLLATALLGFVGVTVLMLPGNTQQIAWRPSLAVLLGTTGWCLGSVLQRQMTLPASRAVTSGAAMMIGGAALLLLSACFGELHPLPHISLRAGLAIGYLVTCGSLLGFTAFVWLLARMPASKVASYAYVNPVVAIALGHFFAGEILTVRILSGAALVLMSVFLILRMKK